MAYIHRMIIYFVDPEGQLTAEDIAEELKNDEWLPNSRVVAAKTKEFEWEDNVIVNKIAATNADYDKFFNND